MARGFLPVDTSGISQGISDAASGLGGWLSNAFTTPDSVVQAEAQRLGYIDAADRELTNDLIQHKAKNILGWSSKSHDPVLSARLQAGAFPLLPDAEALRSDYNINQDYETAVHAAALTHPSGWIRLAKDAHGLIDQDLPIEQAQEAWSDNRIRELSQGGRVSIPELVRQGIGQFPASLAAGVDLNEEKSSPLTRGFGHAIDLFTPDKYTPYEPTLIDAEEAIPAHIYNAMERERGIDRYNEEYTPLNLGQTHADTLQSFFNIPEEPTGSLFGDPSISNANTLMLNSLMPISTGGGMGGFVEETPKGIVQTDMEPTYSERILDPKTWLRDDHIDRMTVISDPTADTYLEALNKSFNPNLASIIDDSGISGNLTPVQEAFDNYVERNVLGVDIPKTTEADAFTVQDDAEASLYPIGTTTGSLLEEPSNLVNINTILQNSLVGSSGPEDMSTDWRNILGIDPNPGYTAKEILGIRESNPRVLNQRTPARRYNRDEFGNVRSLSRFIEPDPSIENLNTLLLNTLVPQEGITAAVSRSTSPVSKTTSQPGPGGPAKPKPEQDDSSNARQAREADDKARADRENKTKQDKAKKENKAKTEKVKTATTKVLESVIKSSSFGSGLSEKQKKEVAKVVTSKKNISNATAAARGDVKSAVTIALTSGDTQRAWAKSKGIDPSTVYGSTLRKTADGGWAGGF